MSIEFDITKIHDLVNLSNKQLSQKYKVSENTAYKWRKEHAPETIRSYKKLGYSDSSPPPKRKHKKKKKKNLNVVDEVWEIEIQQEDEEFVGGNSQVENLQLKNSQNENSQVENNTYINFLWNEKRITADDLRIGKFLYPEKIQKPKTRKDCQDSERPCLYISCRYNLYLEENNGNVKTNNKNPHDLKESCTLDVAAKGDNTLEFIAELFGLTRERVRQIEEKAIGKVRKDKFSLPILKEYFGQEDK